MCCFPVDEVAKLEYAELLSMKSSAYLLLRTGHFVWWSIGFGLTALGLACMTGVPCLLATAGRST